MRQSIAVPISACRVSKAEQKLGIIPAVDLQSAAQRTVPCSFGKNNGEDAQWNFYFEPVGVG